MLITIICLQITVKVSKAVKWLLIYQHFFRAPLHKIQIWPTLLQFCPKSIPDLHICVTVAPACYVRKCQLMPHNRIVKAANTAFYTPHAHRWWGIIFCIFLCFQLMCNFLSVFLTLSRSPPPIQPRTQGNVLISWGQETLELQTNLRKDRSFTITEKAPTWPYETLLRRHAKLALTHMVNRLEIGTLMQGSYWTGWLIDSQSLLSGAFNQKAIVGAFSVICET